MGSTQQLARLAGGLAGLGLAFAAAAPFSGVSPQGVSGAPAPAQVEVRALASGELQVDPIGVVLPAAPFPASGKKGGPFVRVRLGNMTPVPLRLRLRLSGISPSLDDAVIVRGSAAGGVLIDGPLKDASAWTLPAGLLSVGETTTLRLRFKLKPGLREDAYLGRLDIRQLQVQGVPLNAPDDPPVSTSPTVNTPPPTSPTVNTPPPPPTSP